MQCSVSHLFMCHKIHVPSIEIVTPVDMVYGYLYLTPIGAELTATA